MTLKEKVGESAWTLLSSGFATILAFVIAALVPAASPLHKLAVGGAALFGSLTFVGLAARLVINLREISEHHRNHQDLLFVSDRDHIIDRSPSARAKPLARAVKLPIFEVADLADFPPEVMETYRNGDSNHES